MNYGNHKRKKILLVTLWGYKNYGNRLQAIALKQMIKENGFDVVCAATQQCSYLSRFKRLVKITLGFLRYSRFRKIYLQDLRRQALLRTSRTILEPITHDIHGYQTQKTIVPDDYAFAVTGSDQVWHKWSRNEHELPYYYLQFMPENKRISYAASFGFDSFKQEDLSAHTIGLSGMHRISCREQSGCNLVSQLTGTPAELVLDPTLCVGRSFWNQMEQKPFFSLSSRYALVFILGDKKEYLSKIRSYTSEHDLDIIDLFDENRVDVWRTGIGQFIWLVHHAEVIFTDSFHCTVFSILYEKSFTVFRRKQAKMEEMFGRLDTLLKLTETENHIYDGRSIKQSTIDYEKVKKLLEPMQKKSVEWLQHVLHDDLEE